jgi:hypothetical protein
MFLLLLPVVSRRAYREVVVAEGAEEDVTRPLTGTEGGEAAAFLARA